MSRWPRWTFRANAELLPLPAAAGAGDSYSDALRQPLAADEIQHLADRVLVLEAGVR